MFHFNSSEDIAEALLTHCLAISFLYFQSSKTAASHNQL